MRRLCVSENIKRFQSMGVSKDWRVPAGKFLMGSREGGFQSIGVTKDWRRVCVEDKGFYLQPFPINRRHQGLATVIFGGNGPQFDYTGFQSIGITKDWRPVLPLKWRLLLVSANFQ